LSGQPHVKIIEITEFWLYIPTFCRILAVYNSSNTIFTKILLDV
jgi:hypothetical protein